MLLLVFAFHAGDLPLALANLSLAQSMGGCTGFDCLLVTDDQTPHAEMQRVAAQTFRRVEALVLPNAPQGWPRACNVVFERAAKHAWQHYPGQPFLFMEADATPVRPDWLKDIAAAYIANGVPFMGAIRNTYGTDDGRPESQGGRRMIVGRHMNGVGVYPAGYFGVSDILRIVPAGPLPFDVQLSDEQASRPFLMGGRLTTGRVDSPLFAHSWKTRNFRLDGERLVCDQDDPRAEMDEINPRVTALFHGCKDTSLTGLVRARYGDNNLLNYEIPNGKPGVDFIASTGKGNTASGAGDPEYAEFLAWKAQRGTVSPIAGMGLDEMRPQQSMGFIPTFFPVRTPEEQIADKEAVARSSQQQAEQAIMAIRPAFPQRADRQIVEGVAAQMAEETGIDYASGLPAFSEVNQARMDAITSGLPHMDPPVVRPEQSAPISAESLARAVVVPADRNNGLQAPAPPNAVAVDAESHLEPMHDPAQRLASLPLRAETSDGEDIGSIARLSPAQSVDGDALEANFAASVGEVANAVDRGRDWVGIAPGAASGGTDLDSASPGPSSEADKLEAIKADIRSGLVPHKELLRAHSINAVRLKAIRQEVEAENLASV